MPTSTQRSFTVETPLRGFPVHFWFNQFSVAWETGYAVMSFGCLFKGRLLDDVLSFVVSQEALDVGKESIIQYLGRTGEILPMEPSVIPPANRIVPVNVLGMAYRGGIAETALHNFSFKLTLLDSPASNFEAEPVALLRSPINAQRNLIRALYP